MKIKKHLPNGITLLNLLSGCIALVFISTNKYEIAFFFVCLGIFFDFFDGFFARKFNVSGALGLQLDSLADMVTSGVVPGFMMYKLLYINQSKTIGYLSEDYRATVLNSPEDMYSILPYFGFIITLGACYRLANFNF
jgi:CDP-diacylglycerol--serine O-phosphatidyltransferase